MISRPLPVYAKMKKMLGYEMFKFYEFLSSIVYLCGRPVLTAFISFRTLSGRKPEVMKVISRKSEIRKAKITKYFR